MQRDLIALFGAGPAPGAAALRSTDGLHPHRRAAGDRRPGPPHPLRAAARPSGCASSSRPTTWFADDVWAELGQADLLGIALPEADGGGGYGILEACLIAEQVGRTVAPVPYLSSIVAAAHADRPVRQRGAAQASSCPTSSTARPRSPLALYEPDRRRRPGRPHHPGHRRRRRLAPRRREVARGRRRPGRRHPRARAHRPSRPPACSSSRPAPTGVHAHARGGRHRRAAVDRAPRRRRASTRDALLGDARAGRRDRRVDQRPR